MSSFLLFLLLQSQFTHVKIVGIADPKERSRKATTTPLLRRSTKKYPLLSPISLFSKTTEFIVGIERDAVLDPRADYHQACCY
jgi:hypothetical protein